MVSFHEDPEWTEETSFWADSTTVGGYGEPQLRQTERAHQPARWGKSKRQNLVFACCWLTGHDNHFSTAALALIETTYKINVGESNDSNRTFRENL